MSLESMMFVGLQLIALCMAMLFVWALVTYVPPRVVETRIDPPPNAHYQIVSGTAETLDPETEDAIRAQKVAEVFYHALTFNDGFCSVRTLHKIIEQEWNSHYRHFPEYRKHWLISRVFIEAVVTEWDYQKTGRVIQLATIDNNEPRPMVYVLLPAEKDNNETRRLYALDDLTKQFILPKKVKEEKAALPEPELPVVESKPPKDVLLVEDGETGQKGILFDDDGLPEEYELNGHHSGSLWG